MSPSSSSDAARRSLSLRIESSSRDGRAARFRCQAIAQAEAVRGNAAWLVRAPMLCLCKTPGEEGVAALLLLVGRSSERYPAGDACFYAGATLLLPSAGSALFVAFSRPS